MSDQIAELQRSLADSQQKLKEWQRALLSLTPDGSEFCDDPKHCVEFVRERIHGPKQFLALRQKLAESQAAEREYQAHCERDDLLGLLRRVDRWLQHDETCGALHMNPQIQCDCGLAETLVDIAAALEGNKEAR